jgi:site-specific recombinase XerD
MKKTFNQLFFLKKTKSLKNDASTIYLRITVNGVRTEISLQRQCDGTKWSSQSGRVNGKTEEIRALNNYLETVQFRIFEIHKQLTSEGIDYNGHNIKANFLGITESSRNLIEIYTHHNKEFAQLVGKQFSAGTLQRFETCKNSMEKFLIWKFKIKDIDIKKLGYEFLHDYEFYVKTEQKCSHNTTMGYIKKLRKIIRQCVAKNWLDKDPFMAFKITLTETHRTILNEEELQTVANKKFVSKRMDQVRDLFIFSCFTGLAYADVSKLTKQDIVRGIDGDLWIHTTRTKTDTASRIPILSTAMDMINKYKDQPEMVANNKLFPMLTNQKMNEYLKELADLCNINKELTFHCARHTFATTVTLSNGVPIETVGKMLGHRSIRTTQIYAKVLDNKVSDDMKSLKSMLSIIPAAEQELKTTAG